MCTEQLKAMADHMVALGLDYQSTPHGLLLCEVDGITLYNENTGAFIVHVVKDTWMVTPTARFLLHTELGNNRNVEICFDTDTSEYVCQLIIKGEHYEPADYFTEDKADAYSTASQMVKEI